MQHGQHSAYRALRAILLPPSPFPATLEQGFLDAYARRHALQRRIAVAIAVFTALSFLPWDVIHQHSEPDFPLPLWAILGLRFSNILALSVAFLVSLRPRFEQDERHASQVLMQVTLVCYVSFAATTALVGYPFDLLYGVAAFLSVVFSYSVLRLRARPIHVLMAASLAMSAIVYAQAWHAMPAVPSHIERVHGMVMFQLLIAFSILGIFVGNMAERDERARFKRERELAMLNTDLTRRHDEIKRLSQELAESSRAREQKAEALLRAEAAMRQSAEAHSREISMFLANAVHDLKQPLQAIGNALESAFHAADRSDRDSMLEMLDLTRVSTALMREQLSAILELSHLQSARLQPMIVSVDVKAMLASLVQQYEGVAQREAISLRLIDDVGTPCLTESDPHFLRRIFSNLITNGLKYRRDTPAERSWVNVRLLRQAAGFAVAIEDNGTGIPDDGLEQDRIFKPFFQASNNQLREARRGVGLGLSIVRNMLDLLPHHGITVESRLGQGSTFTVSLPLSEARMALPVVDQALPLDPAMLEAIEGAYVLLVEDDEFVLKATRRLLESHGLHCDAFESYEAFAAAIDLVDRIPDCVLSDYRLPNGRTAADVARRARDTCETLPTVVFTGENIDTSHPDVREFCLLLRKPVSADTLLAAIAACQPPGSDRT